MCFARVLPQMIDGMKADNLELITEPIRGRGHVICLYDINRMPKINPDLRDESSNHDIVVYQPFGTFSA
jgi:hypothetical protein